MHLLRVSRKQILMHLTMTKVYLQVQILQIIAHQDQVITILHQVDRIPQAHRTKIGAIMYSHLTFTIITQIWLIKIQLKTIPQTKF